MRKWMRGLVAGAVLSLVGCSGSGGSSECDDITDGIETYEQKGQPCDTASNPLPRFDTRQCERTINDCSQDEKQVLATFADCLRKMPACTSSTRADFEAALDECSRPADLGIGGACGDVLGLD
jgi:hypothetical protein